MPLASDQGIRPGKLHPFAAEHKDRMRAGAQNRKRVAATISFSSPISGQAIVNRVVIPTRASSLIFLSLCIAAAMLAFALLMTTVSAAPWFDSTVKPHSLHPSHVSSPDKEPLLLTTNLSRRRPAHAKSLCDECGVVESIRPFPASADAPASDEITVRMRDGTTRANRVPSSSNWRRGQQIIVIGGSDSLHK